jgi:hypothetical protein
MSAQVAYLKTFGIHQNKAGATFTNEQFSNHCTKGTDAYYDDLPRCQSIWQPATSGYLLRFPVTGGQPCEPCSISKDSGLVTGNVAFFSRTKSVRVSMGQRWQHKSLPVVQGVWGSHSQWDWETEEYGTRSAVADFACEYAENFVKVYAQGYEQHSQLAKGGWCLPRGDAWNTRHLDPDPGTGSLVERYDVSVDDAAHKACF